MVKVEGLDFIHDNFDAQGFNTGGGVEKWKPRKPPQGTWRKRSKTLKGGKSQQLRATKAGGKYLRDKNRALLVKRGHLRRAWDSNTQAKPGEVAFKNSMPYSGAHNEGLRSGRGSGFIMPERRMIGDSKELDKRIMAKIETEIKKLISP